MPNPSDLRVGVIRIEGTNCEDESAAAFSSLGCNSEKVHLKQLLGEVEESSRRNIMDYDALYFPGGFSSGDYIRAGAIFAARIKSGLKSQVDEFIKEGRPVLGICNGFQILTEIGLLPGALMRNSKLKFICRNLDVRVDETGSIFTKKYQHGQKLSLPVAHNDGNYFADAATLDQLEEQNRIAFRYVNATGKLEPDGNPNGSVGNIAGILNKEKNVLGLMPHPENATDSELGGTDGYALFQSIVENLS